MTSKDTSMTNINITRLLACLVLACVLLTGCEPTATCPLVPIVPMELTPDRASAIIIPSSSFAFDSTVDSSLTKTLSPLGVSLEAYPLVPASRFSPGDVDSIRIIQNWYEEFRDLK